MILQDYLQCCSGSSVCHLTTINKSEKYSNVLAIYSGVVGHRVEVTLISDIQLDAIHVELMTFPLSNCHPQLCFATIWLRGIQAFAEHEWEQSISPVNVTHDYIESKHQDEN